MAAPRAKEAVRNPVRAEARPDPRSAPNTFKGRNGELLSFRSSEVGHLDIPEDLKEEGWSYQWQTVTVFGEPSHDIAEMYSRSWRYVTADSRVGPRHSAIRRDDPGPCLRPYKCGEEQRNEG